MQITYETLAQTAEVGSWSLNAPSILNIVHRFYCGPMNVRGLCTQNCQSCAASLKYALHLNHITPRNPGAMLTTALRREVGLNAERAQKQPAAPEQDIFGCRKVADDPYGSFIASLTNAIEGVQLETETEERRAQGSRGAV